MDSDNCSMMYSKSAIGWMIKMLKQEEQVITYLSKQHFKYATILLNVLFGKCNHLHNLTRKEERLSFV